MTKTNNRFIPNEKNLKKKKKHGPHDEVRGKVIQKFSSQRLKQNYKNRYKNVFIKHNTICVRNEITNKYESNISYKVIDNTRECELIAKKEVTFDKNDIYLKSMEVKDIHVLTPKNFCFQNKDKLFIFNKVHPKNIDKTLFTKS